MTLDLDTRAPIRATADSGRAFANAPVLIQVPALAGRRGRPAASRPALGRRSRRRLRREVRVAATALLCAVPLSWAMLTFGWDRMGAHPDGPDDGAAASASIDEPPVIAISIEPAALSTNAAPRPPRDAAPPVVLEEIVPDLGAEEAAHHAGG